MLTITDYPGVIGSAALASTVAAVFYLFQPALCQTSNALSQNNVTEEKISSNDAASDDATNKKDCVYLLSLVIPAYNEEARLPPMLKKTLDYLMDFKDEIVHDCNQVLGISPKDISHGQRCSEGHSHRPPFFQIIIVNDGSSDGTHESIHRFVHQEYARKQDLQSIIDMTVLTLHENSGKGAAVKTGMLRSEGKLALMLDADGATEISSLRSLLGNMACSQSEVKIVFGSRAHLQEKSKAERSLVRTMLMNAFHFFVKILIGDGIQDTQCGFKLFRGDVVHAMFDNLHLQRWAFDIELVVIAEQLGIQISEVGVEWQEIDGSKLNTGKIPLLLASAGMLRDMICVRLCYALKLWRLKTVMPCMS